MGLGLKTMRALVLTAPCMGLIGSAIAADPTAALFDKPVKMQRVPLPHDPDNPQARARVSCFTYSHFMVKEVDLGEIGAEQLSILPLSEGQKPPVCRRENEATERVVDVKEWSGYFKGAKGDAVFFDAEDGWNGGLGFAAFTADAKKIFEDVAKSWREVAATPGGVALRYRRVFDAKCSLMADAAGCWHQVKEATGLTDAAPPDCRAAYQREQKRTPAFARQIVDDPTVIEYDVSVAVEGGAAKITPVAGTKVACRPSE